MQLQRLDSELDAVQRRLAAVEAALGESESVRATRREAEEKRALARRWAARQRELELQIGGLVDKIQRDEQRLYSGVIHSARELSDLQAEVASERRRQQHLEEELLNVMIEREGAEAAQTAAEERLRAAEEAWATEQAKLQAEREGLQARLRVLQQERSEVVSRISTEDLTLYRRLRERKGGIAVAFVQDDACSACGVAVTPARKWQIREGQLVTCGNCERILVIAEHR